MRPRSGASALGGLCGAGWPSCRRRLRRRRRAVARPPPCKLVAHRDAQLLGGRRHVQGACVGVVQALADVGCTQAGFWDQESKRSGLPAQSRRSSGNPGQRPRPRPSPTPRAPPTFLPVPRAVLSQQLRPPGVGGALGRRERAWGRSGDTGKGVGAAGLGPGTQEQGKRRGRGQVAGEAHLHGPRGVDGAGVGSRVQERAGQLRAGRERRAG
jgi:hypothetical protein